MSRLTLPFFCTVTFIMLLCNSVFAAYPYDAVGKIVAGNAGGSGTMIATANNQGLILTNAHVVSKVSKGTIWWPSKQAKRNWVTVFVDYEHDIALLRVDMPPVRGVPHRMPVGNFIVSTGYPHYDRANLHWQASIGLRVNGHKTVVTHKPVPGMSGGGAFDYGGYLIGIVQAHNRTDGILVSNKPLMDVLAKYQDPGTWEFSDEHVQVPEPTDWTPAPLVKQIRSIKYDELTAPELPDATTKLH